jgi:mRNA interferase RelE/StbE
LLNPLILAKTMTSITIKQMPSFKRAYKKLHAHAKEKTNDAILTIMEDPTIGQEKKAELTGIFVHKFRIHHQEMLLAYEWDTEQIILLALGVHENFYRDLKKKTLHEPPRKPYF